jgi:hypothetical protein
MAARNMKPSLLPEAIFGVSHVHHHVWGEEQIDIHAATHTISGELEDG